MPKSRGETCLLVVTTLAPVNGVDVIPGKFAIVEDVGSEDVGFGNVRTGDVGVEGDRKGESAVGLFCNVQKLMPSRSAMMAVQRTKMRRRKRLDRPCFPGCVVMSCVATFLHY